MGAERAQGGRGWVRIPASRAEQSPARPAGPAGPGGPSRAAPYGSAPYGSPQYGSASYGSPQYGSPQYGSPQYGSPQYGAPGSYGAFGAGDPAAIYLALVKRWREAGRTLPGHPDEEWERLISQPCWPGR
ncbi:hypothetical protein AB0P15_19465 [Streptomyces sp. NPDC087917]|uniref:hypothetical protein n=1 Tax=Streptomyces sp. NPDC087917 TaxID=3155060 RepID=UPI00342D4AB2